VQPSDDSSKNAFTGPAEITHSPGTICVAAIRSLRNTDFKRDLYLFGYKMSTKLATCILDLCRYYLEPWECVIDHED